MVSAYVHHHLAGRTRLRIPAHRRDTQFFASAVETLRAAPGVSTVGANAALASLLIHHDCSLAELADYGAKHGLFKLDRYPAPAASLSVEIAHYTEGASRLTRQVLGPSVDTRGLATITLGALALAQLASGQVLPPAISLLWYTFALANAPVKELAS